MMSEGGGEHRSDTPKWVAALAVAVAAVAFSAWARVEVTLSAPGFDARSAEGLMKSDPALLYYLTRRVVDSGGAVPEDFRADRRIEHPDARDLPAMLPVGQEFLIAWAFLAFGGDLPLHAFALVFMSGVASLTALGVFGLAAEVTRRPGAAALAACLYATSLASYRTTGLLFMREDLSLPLYAVHLWLFARAARRSMPIDFMLAGLSLLLAVSTWHAMTLVAAVEAACLFAWSLVSGRNPFAQRGAWIGVAVMALGSLVVPVLRAKLFVLSPTMQLAAALLAASALVRRFGPVSPLRNAAFHLAPLGVVALVALAWNRANLQGAGDFGHVFELLLEKLRFLGTRPEDPTLLSFGARIMWEPGGPFDNLSPADLLRLLPVSVPLVVLQIPLAARALRRPGSEVGGALVIAYAAIWVALALLVQRNVSILAIVAPVAAVWMFQKLRGVPSAVVAGALVAAQIGWMSLYFGSFGSGWYEPGEVAARRQMIEWIRSNLPPKDPIASDVINSAALLAHTEHPVVLQPNWETQQSRDRLERIVTALYRESPAAFSRLLREEFDCRYVLVDPIIFWYWGYLAGVGPVDPPGSAAEALLAPGQIDGVPGFRLLYRTRPKLHDFRLYALEDAVEPRE